MRNQAWQGTQVLNESAPIVRGASIEWWNLAALQFSSFARTPSARKPEETLNVTGEADRVWESFCNPLWLEHVMVSCLRHPHRSFNHQHSNEGRTKETPLNNAPSLARAPKPCRPPE